MDINEIVSNFQIIGHCIKSLEITNDFVYLEVNDESIHREINVSYELGAPFEVEQRDDSIGGSVLLYIDTAIYNDKDASSIHLVLEGGFVLNGEKDEEKLNMMLAVNGCAALYSIGRGIISGITSQMSMEGSGTILLPMINTFELRENSEDI